MKDRKLKAELTYGIVTNLFISSFILIFFIIYLFESIFSISSLFQFFFKWASDSSIQNLSSCMIVRLVQIFMTSGDNIRTNTWAFPQTVFSSVLTFFQISLDLCYLTHCEIHRWSPLIILNNLWNKSICCGLRSNKQLTSLRTE